MKHCLVVDDSAVIRKVARRILERLSFRVSDAEDGAQGLAICREEMPDAILVDATMPEVDGFAFVKALRALPGGRGPRVVFCVVDNDVAQVARAMHAGADDYMMKPFDRELVSEKLQDAGVVAAEA
jgi:two-component system chemotaxis response regulator CheY